MVNLGADIAATLPFLREQANSRMTEVFQFFTSATVLNETTLEDEVVETEIGTTPGRLKNAGSQGRDVESGNQFPVLSRLEVHIPATATSPIAPSPWLLPGEIIPAFAVPVGAFVRCIDSSADVSLIGRVFRVSEPPSGGQITARRYPVEETS